MDKYTIKNNNVIEEKTFEEALVDYKGLIYKFAKKMAVQFKAHENSMYKEADDYFHDLIFVLKKALISYDVDSDAQFSTYLISALTNARIDTYRSLTSQKRNMKDVVYLDNKNSKCGNDQNEDISYIESISTEDVIELDKKMSLEEYINKSLTKEEKLLIVADLKESDKKKDQNVAFLDDVLRDGIGKGRILKKDVCEELHCSKPTLQKRTNAAKTRLQEIVSHYVGSENDNQLFEKDMISF